MTPFHIPYIAGLIDGEGCVTIVRNKKVNTFSPLVQVAMTERRPIEFIHSLYSGNVRFDRNLVNRQSIHIWNRSTQTGCLDFLQACLPFLLVKDIHARLVIDFITECSVGGGNKRNVNTVGRSLEFWQAIRILNSGKNDPEFEKKEALKSSIREQINGR